MALHLIKLAVGCESVKELKGWVAERMQTARKKGLPLQHIHITRMTPKRVDELLAGGSLYWVIRGEIAAREKIIAIEPFRDRDGIGRCGRSRAGAISSKATFRRISNPQAPASRRCPSLCAANCATSGCFRQRRYRSAGFFRFWPPSGSGSVRR